jgi:2-oxoisovalerate dehydrogenase E2 component (dihydrolipoyl transacylase)
MTDCTERAQRSEGREGMPARLSMTDCTERAQRSEGREGMRMVGRA